VLLRGAGGAALGLSTSGRAGRVIAVTVLDASRARVQLLDASAVRLQIADASDVRVHLLDVSGPRVATVDASALRVMVRDGRDTSAPFGVRVGAGLAALGVGASGVLTI